jgi:hypothetical protein
VDRKKLQALARERLKDARALLGRKRWSGAYYLAGYVIECSLKACLLRHLGESASIFGDPTYLRRLGDCWTHDFVKLLNLAGLEADFGTACGANPALAAFWVAARNGRKPPGMRRRLKWRRRNCTRQSATTQMGCSDGYRHVGRQAD